MQKGSLWPVMSLPNKFLAPCTSRLVFRYGSSWRKNIGLQRGLDLAQHLHGGDLKELLVLLLVHVEAGLHVLDQLHLVHLQVNVGLDEKSQ